MTTKTEALAVLEAAATAAAQAEQAQTNAARAAHAAGASWADIAGKLGITKQRAHQRYSGPARDTSRDHHYTPAENNEADKALAALQTVAASKIVDEDRAGDSLTPSIFLDPIAPATPGASVNTHGVTVFKPKNRQHAAILPRGSKPIRTHAEPGTGKGPHLCTGCGTNNHHGARRGIIEWNDGCSPTKYDTQAETDYLNGLTK